MDADSPLSHPTVRALLIIVLFTYVAQNMLNVSIAPLARALTLPEWVVGLAVSLAAVTVTLLSQFWGRRSVAWGRRRVLLSALVLALIAGSVFALTVHARVGGLIGAVATSIGLVAARGPFFGSAVAAIPPTGQALIAELTPDERSRLRGMSAFSGAVQLSIMVGSVISSALASWDILAPVYATPWFVAVALLLAWWRVPRDQHPAPSAGRHRVRSLAADAADSVSSTATVKTVGSADTAEPATATAALPPRVSWRDPRVLPWICAALGTFFTNGVVQITTGFLVQDRLGLSTQDTLFYTGMMLLANAAGAMLTQLVVVPQLSWSPLTLVRLGTAIGVGGLAALVLSPSLWGLLISTFVLGVSTGLVAPGFNAGGSLAVTQREQGGVAGILNATGAVTWIFAPVSATALYGVYHLLPFAVAGSILLASTLCAWFLPALRRR